MWGERAQGLMSSFLQIPVSTCSRDCQPGQKKKAVGLHTCCFECLDCTPGTFLNKSAGTTCRFTALPCPCPAQDPYPLAAPLGSPWGKCPKTRDHVWCHRISPIPGAEKNAGSFGVGGRRKNIQPCRAVTDPHPHTHSLRPRGVRPREVHWMINEWMNEWMFLPIEGMFLANRTSLASQAPSIVQSISRLLSEYFLNDFFWLEELTPVPLEHKLQEGEDDAISLFTLVFSTVQRWGSSYFFHDFTD